MSVTAFLLCIPAIGLLHYLRLVKARAVLNDWAVANRFTILKTRWMLGAPTVWLFNSSKWQMFYDVSIYDESRMRIRHAWVKLGTPQWGILNGDAIDVRWKEERGLASGP